TGTEIQGNCANRPSLFHVIYVQETDEFGFLCSQQTNAELSWRDYYSDRNELRMLKAHHPLAYHVEAEYILRVAHSHYITNGLTAKDKVSLEALKDAILNHGGLHAIYQPGWKFAEKDKLSYPKYWIIAYLYVRIRSFFKKNFRKNL
ncbi:MAG: hypothetical protein MJ231_08935, partial [bacterium]|nr:hypothetical protein [bacterium]